MPLSVDAPATKPVRKKKRQINQHDTDDPRPVIRLAAGQIDRIATEAEDVLKESGLPIFQRGIGARASP